MQFPALVPFWVAVSRSPWLHFRTLALLLLVFLLLPACGSTACPSGLQPYKGGCMTLSTINYVSCTEDRGKNLSGETKVKFDAALKGALTKVIGAGGSVEVAEKLTQEENTPVVLQIVNDCLNLTKNDPAVPTLERNQAAAFQKQIEQQLIQQTPPALTLSSPSARKGASVTVQGTNFVPKEPIKVYLHATLVAQITADANGTFSVTITVPNDAPPPSFSTTISAVGAASGRSAEASFHTAP